MSRNPRPLSPVSLSQQLLRDPQSSLPALATEVERASPANFLRDQSLWGFALSLAADQSSWIAEQLARSWLSSPDPRLRVLATNALPLLQKSQREQYQTLIESALRDPAPAVRAVAAARLASSPDIPSELLAPIAADPDREVRIALARALRRSSLSDAAFKALEKLLEDPDPTLSWAAGEAIEASAQKNLQRAWEILSRSAALGSQQRRLAIARSALEGIFAQSFESLAPTIRSWLKTAPTPARWTLAQSLGRCPYSTRLIQILTQLSTDPDADIRLLVARSILRIATRLSPTEAEAFLSRGEADPDSRNRAAFQEARYAFTKARQSSELQAEDSNSDDFEEIDEDND